MKPLVNLNSRPAQPTTAAVPAARHDDTLEIAAGGLLALLILGGIAAALMRRRRVHEEEWVGEEPIEPAAPIAAQESRPISREQQPTIIAPPVSAFSWANGAGEASRSEEPMVEEERLPGESWIERAYRGPSPSNPSVSLRTRLKRAAFFDKREREAAAGLAEPVDTTAGLPEAMVAEQERELA